jgi:SSS family solute:Na+ symporter
MAKLDWVVLGCYFALMLLVGVWAKSKVKTASDFFTAGGAMPWWLSGISHHMSGYSSAVFVGYAAIAYIDGITIYVWWAFTIALGLVVGSRIFAPRWALMRQRFHVISPLEYLVARYNLTTQQALAWSGAALKVFDVGAKWTASAILLHAFAGVPVVWGVLLTGGVTLVYSVVGGLWADALTDLSQFLIQLVAGMAMLIAVLHKLGGVSALWTIWGKLPPSHHHPFTGHYTLLFALAYMMINFLSYNGGTWNLAQRFIASPSPQQARKSALLSASLYLVWPLVLLFPMWASPLIFPGLEHPAESYAMLTTTLLPPGLVGLVLAGLFAHTMAMTSSDANAISAVVVRDIVPAMRKSRLRPSDKAQLLIGRVCTFCFLAASMGIALMSDHFGGIIGLLVLWYGALVGPIAVPMLLGMLWPFRRSGPLAALLSWLLGALTFGAMKIWSPESWLPQGSHLADAVTVGAPVALAILVYVGVGLVFPYNKPAAEEFLKALDAED